MLADASLRELLAAFASPDPTPGGGSASAVSAALGASLLVMVATLPKTRAGSDDDRAALAAAAATLGVVQLQLIEAIDLDAAAYDHVVAAYKLPKGTDAEQAARKVAVERALVGATDVPLAVMRLSAAALAQARAVAAHGHRAASSDVGVAAALLGAGFHGARLNVAINLRGLKDAAYVEGVESEMVRLGGASADATTAVESLLR